MVSSSTVTSISLFLSISKCVCVYLCSFHSVAGGMNGSIVYELERPENAGLKKSVKACSVSLFFCSLLSPLFLLLFEEFHMIVCSIV